MSAPEKRNDFHTQGLGVYSTRAEGVVGSGAKCQKKREFPMKKEENVKGNNNEHIIGGIERRRY